MSPWASSSPAAVRSSGKRAAHVEAPPARSPDRWTPQSPALLAVRAVARRPVVPDTVVVVQLGGGTASFGGNGKRPVHRGAHRPLQFERRWQMTARERRTDLAKRRRIDDLLERARAARAEIVRTGLTAVHGMGGSCAGDTPD